MNQLCFSKEQYTTNGIFDKPHNIHNIHNKDSVCYIPKIDLAFISNHRENDFHITSYQFNTISISFDHFKMCFFASPLNHFYLSPSNLTTSYLSLDQTYMDTTNSKKKFNLEYALQNAWAQYNHLPVSAIPIDKKISLTKNTKLTKSLGSFICGSQYNLSLDEALQSLLESEEITGASMQTCATIDFQIVVLYSYPSLSISLELHFIYRVNVPGYRNKFGSNPYYSKDCTPPRNYFGFTMSEYSGDSDDEIISEFSRNKKEYFEHLIDEQSIITESSGDIISQVSKLLNSEFSFGDSVSW